MSLISKGKFIGFYSRDLIFRMSVNILRQERWIQIRLISYDMGDDWEIGVGNLIIDLDADLEKDDRNLK